MNLLSAMILKFHLNDVLSHFTEFPVEFYPHRGILHSGGIQISGWKGAEIALQKNLDEPLHQTYQFVPFISERVNQYTPSA